MQAVVPRAVMAALMMAASISSPYLIAFFVDVLIGVFSNLYRSAVYRKTKENRSFLVFSCFSLFGDFAKQHELASIDYCYFHQQTK